MRLPEHPCQNHNSVCLESIRLPEHPCQNHNIVRVSKAYDYQSIHAKTIIPFVFQEHTNSRASYSKRHEHNNHGILGSLAGAGKRCLRRLNLLGSGSKNHDHVNVLAAHHLLTGPGLQRVLAALCAFRATVRGTCSPNEAFKSPL